MTAVGTSPGTVLPPARSLTTLTAGITVGAADVQVLTLFACGFARRVVANAAGTVFIQRSGDTAPVAYAMLQGQAVEGRITLIGGSTNHAGASAIALVLET